MNSRNASKSWSSTGRSSTASSPSSSGIRWIAAAASCVIVCAASSAQSSSFDLASDGWAQVTLPCGALPCPPPSNPPTELGAPTAPTHQTSGGNPAGWIFGVDPDGAGAGHTQYWRAPAAYLGNKGARFGGSLRYDVIQTTPFMSFQQEDVLLVGAGLTLSASAATVPPQGVWTAFAFPLQVGAWRVGGSSGALASEAQLKAVLGNLVALYVRAEHQLNVDKYGFDNVVLEGPCGAGVVATQNVRVGSPANPAALLPAASGGPVVGNTWDPVIDHTSFLPNALADVLALATLPAQIPTPNGTILCDIGAPPLFLFVKPPSVPFALAVPADCSLVGVSLCTQGASVDAAGFALTNALDITLGAS